MKKILKITLPIIFIFLMLLFLFLKDDLEFDLLLQKPYKKTPQEIQKDKERIEKYLYSPIDEDLAKEIKAPWKDCEKGIYFNPETLEINGNTRTAWFRTFRARDRNLTPYDLEDTDEAAYTDVKVKAWCFSDGHLLELQTKYYDKNKKLLKNYINEHTITAPYYGSEDGKTYFKVLCEQ